MSHRHHSTACSTCGVHIIAMAPAAACVLAFTFAPTRDAAGSDAVAQEPWSGAPISAARLEDFKGKHGETLISRMRERAAKEHSGEGPIELRFERFAWGLGGAKFLQDFVKEVRAGLLLGRCPLCCPISIANALCSP